MKEKVFVLLKEHGIDPAAVKAIASVDVKQDEPAVLDLKQLFDGECLHQPCEQRFYTPEQLNQVPGDFKESAFVKKQIGVCLLYTSPSPRDGLLSRMPSSA